MKIKVVVHDAEEGGFDSYIGFACNWDPIE